MILGIGGMSRSGKTSLAHRIKDQYSNGSAVVFSLDDFAIPESEIPMIHDMIDWEHPDSIDFERLHHAVIEGSIDYSLVIVEGFLIYTYGPLRGLFDKRICITISKEEFEQRRKKQYDEPQWYLDHIWDSYYRYQGKFENQCDLLLDGNSEIDFTAVMAFIE